MNCTRAPACARVWLVDDSVGQAEVVRRALQASYVVEVFHDGASVLEAFTRTTPDILVLDWHMPEVSGLDVCRFVRESRGPSELPILILTATSNQNDLITAFNAGANDFVRKPCDGGELTARIEGLERSRRLHARLQAAAGMLRDEAELRERFIAVLGHDLRQPLSAIYATAQTLSRSSDVAAGSKRIEGAAQRMARMIDDVLDFSRGRVGAGMLLNRVPVSLDTIVERAVDEARAAHARHEIDTSYGHDLAGEWDVDRMAQVCSNLLDNAIKHGRPATPITVEAEGTADAVTIRITNTGAIPQSSRTSLFDAFSQGESASPRSGLGLGLFIVDQIVRAHGGSVVATSDEGATSFTVNLPRRAPKQPASGSL